MDSINITKQMTSATPGEPHTRFSESLTYSLQTVHRGRLLRHQFLNRHT